MTNERKPTNQRMSDEEILWFLIHDSVLNKARRTFSAECARIEQATTRPQALDVLELRRMEFDAVRKIAAALGVVV